MLAGKQRADRGGVGAHLPAGAVDHQRHLGSARGEELATGPDPGDDGGGDEERDEDAPHREPPDPRAPAAARGRRAFVEQLGDRHELVDAREGQPGRGIVRLGARRRRCRRGLGGREGVSDDRFGFGDDRGLHLGVRVEQRVHRGELVDVVGEREPRRRIVRFGSRGRRRDHGLQRHEVDLVAGRVDHGGRLFQQGCDRREAVRIGHRQPRGRIVRFRARGRRPDDARDVRGERSAGAAKVNPYGRRAADRTVRVLGDRVPPLASAMKEVSP